jgi:hypothetical protein
MFHAVSKCVNKGSQIDIISDPHAAGLSLDGLICHSLGFEIALAAYCPHPEEPHPLVRRLEGWPRVHALRPSFETRAREARSSG